MAAGVDGRLGPDRAVLSRPAAERLDVGLGDTINIQFPSLEFAALEVVGVFDDETVGVPLIIDYTTFEDCIDFRLDRFLYLKVADGVDLESARTAITVVTDGYPNGTHRYRGIDRRLRGADRRLAQPVGRAARVCHPDRAARHREHAGALSG